MDKMQKNIQIPMELFMAIVKYHLFDMDEYADEIRKGLETKVEAAYRRGLYSDYKTKPNPKEREQARQKYLDERGVPEDFRW